MLVCFFSLFSKLPESSPHQSINTPSPQPIIDEETGPQRLNLPNISKFHSQNLTPSLQASKLLLKNEESVKTKIDFHLMKVMTISIMSTSYYS